MAAATHERLLYQALRELFPKDQIYKNVTKDLNFKYPVTGGYMEFDLWIPNYQLCFEFQDAYHYKTVWYFHNTKDAIQQKDYLKQEKARQNGMCLIPIPFWWNGLLEDIIEEIRFFRPDLCSLLLDSVKRNNEERNDEERDNEDNNHSSNVMPLNPPEAFSRNMAEVPDVGELMLVSHPHYNFTTEGGLWWMGEKYDGIRCLWNNIRKAVFTRYGNIVPLLPSMINSLPTITTDNELWVGRGQYYFSCVVVKETQHFHWPMVRLFAFDAPDNVDSYERRYNNLLNNYPANHPFSFVVPRLLLLQGYNQFNENVIQNGGEGVILQRYNSFYEPGRSLSLIKIKTTQADQEAIVVGMDDSGSVTLKMPTERTFEVAADNTIKNLKLGDIVTYSYESRSRQDMPLNARIERVRLDITWDNILQSAPHSASNSDSPAVFTIRERGYWNEGRIREFMVNFANSFQLNPLEADTWIKLSRTFRKSKEGRTILSKFGNAYFQVLKKIFPEVSFDITLVQKYIWRKVENRRLFFERFARKNKFDPLQPTNWYDFSKHKGLMAMKGIRGVLSYHEYRISNALMDLFPNIGFDKNKLKRRSMTWSKPEHRRRFFEDYAIEEGFDHKNPESWYSQPRKKILSKKGAQIVMMYHRNSLSKALTDLFPEIGLDRSRFQDQQVLSDPERWKQFFINFASKFGFDAIIPSNWYNKVKKIESFKVSKKVLQYHNNSAVTALVELFPEIKFNGKFVIKDDSWAVPAKRREFFIQYAENKRFNPNQAENWYLQSPYKISSLKGAKEIMSFHNNSVSQALLDLFPKIGLDPSKL